jgi:hypothetical protein
MADKEIHHYSSGGGGGSGIGAFLGIIVGAVLVVGLLYVFANNWDGGSNVSVNVPAAPSAPSAPSTSGSAPSR